MGKAGKPDCYGDGSRNFHAVAEVQFPVGSMFRQRWRAFRAQGLRAAVTQVAIEVFKDPSVRSRRPKRITVMVEAQED